MSKSKDIADIEYTFNELGLTIANRHDITTRDKRDLLNDLARKKAEAIQDIRKSHKRTTHVQH